MEIKIYGGINEIGGNKIFININERRFLFDFGLSFNENNQYFSEFLSPRKFNGIIDYLYLGDKLGGYRSGGYQAFTTTAEFGQGIEIVETVASQRRSVLLCAERLPWRCHRRFIAAELEKIGWQVKHIIDEKRTWLPRDQIN